jgi:hypothetical protein
MNREKMFPQRKERGVGRQGQEYSSTIRIQGRKHGTQRIKSKLKGLYTGTRLLIQDMHENSLKLQISILN